jgi:hypothetical protein
LSLRRIIDLAQVRQLPVAGAAIFDLSQQPSRIGTDAYEKMPELAVIPGSASKRSGALAGTEAVTGLPTIPFRGVLTKALARWPSFREKELVDLMLAVIAINGWSRLAVSFQAVPGSYQPARMRAFG